jgi:hypothetical protein
VRWAGHVACVMEKKNVYMVLVRKPEGKRQIERPTYRWEDNIKAHLKEIRFEYMEFIHWVRLGSSYRLL